MTEKRLPEQPEGVEMDEHGNVTINAPIAWVHVHPQIIGGEPPEDEEKT